MGFAALSPSYVGLSLGSPLQDRLCDCVGLVELGEMAGAGDDLDLGPAGDRAGDAAGVGARHHAVLFAPQQQRRRGDQREALLQPGQCPKVRSDTSVPLVLSLVIQEGRDGCDR